MHTYPGIARLCFVFLVTVSLAACATMKEPQVTLSCSADRTGQLVFGINKNQRVLGMSDFMVWIEGSNEYLWALTMNYGKTNSIQYGEIPAKAVQSGVAQTHPKNSTPRAIRPGERFYVAVHFMYDSPVAGACSGTAVYRFQREEDGIKNLGLVERYAMPGDPGQ
jgi:hypothetical protein